MFEAGTDTVFKSLTVPLNIFLQILPNLEFVYATFLETLIV